MSDATPVQGSPTPERRIVMVEWVDSVMNAGGWVAIDKFKDAPALACISVGALLVDGEHIKVVAPHWHEDDQNLDADASMNGLMIIPARAVTRIRDLSPVLADAPEHSLHRAAALRTSTV